MIPISLIIDDCFPNFDSFDLCDGFIIPGGSSIDKTIYYLIDYALRNNKPVLGICLGAQAIANYSLIREKMDLRKRYTLEEIINIYESVKKENEGRLIKPIPKSIVRNHTNYNSIARHFISIDEDSIAYKIFKKKTMKVSSFHKYQFINIGKDFRVTGKSTDGVNEIIEHEKEPLIIGVQFHPELMDKTIFDYFIDQLYN